MPLTADDLITIQAAIAEGGKIWENVLLTNVKRKIKTHYLGVTTEQCCYCKRDMRDEFMMVIDIEHVLPKSQFPDYMFELFNLSVSCKRCNMLIKGDSTEFLFDRATVSLQPRDTEQYRLIHPNLDDYFENIEYIVQIKNNKKSIKYLQLKPKGVYTYSFFRLDKLEVNTLNNAQGIEIANTELSSDIPMDLIIESTVLLNQL
ncbi:hypothetical protein OQX61_23035 [Pedobacter sp. PLR]|uniref:hypothetical protein n=1 Tax=Pedobacter sp. PLR TaxID=2994465 RepID=UPI0022475F6E|nr:hypothetical protein [Pedobacter sp. PLR]MCX2454164.1 hypothetical protein [Pedobacter sp. PLR]